MHGMYAYGLHVTAINMSYCSAIPSHCGPLCSSDSLLVPLHSIRPHRETKSKRCLSTCLAQASVAAEAKFVCGSLCAATAEPDKGTGVVADMPPSAESNEPIAEMQATTASDQPVLSKNAQKKAAKKARFAANKAAAKAVEKAAKQADSARRREEVQQKFGAMTEEERNIWRTERQAKRQNRKSETGEKRARLQQAMAEGQSIIIDCDFEEQMTESEIKSLCGQLQYCYASNIRATKPCHLSFTSLKGAIAQQAQQQLSGMENWFITKTSESYLRAYQDQREQLVYLTADSPEELSELHPTRKYIIGGIVDRNRHKNICFRKAEAQGIKTARLPIGAYMKLASSQVLTVNHVVDILLSWLELRDWQQAFYKVIPTRKRFQAAECDATAGARDVGDCELRDVVGRGDVADNVQEPQQAIEEQTATDVGTAAEPQTADDAPVLNSGDQRESKRLKPELGQDLV